MHLHVNSLAWECLTMKLYYTSQKQHGNSLVSLLIRRVSDNRTVTFSDAGNYAQLCDSANCLTWLQSFPHTSHAEKLIICIFLSTGTRLSGGYRNVRSPSFCLSIISSIQICKHCSIFILLQIFIIFILKLNIGPDCELQG